MAGLAAFGGILHRPATRRRTSAEMAPACEAGAAPANAGVPILRFDAASLEAWGRTILAPTSLTISERRVAIIGRNGSGKTSLLRLAAGLARPTSGAIALNGADPFADRAFALANIGILFQNPDHQILFPTVGEEMAFGLIQAGMPAEDADRAVRAALAVHGRGDWHARPTHILSHGQRQWVCLQSILLMKPKTVLLDEPFSGLDLPTRLVMARHLAALDQQILLVTHDPQDAAGMERVIWMEGGRIVADGRPREILPNYLDCMNDLGHGDADTDLA
jgi:biotin transport system ATP-binding protein